MKIKKILLIISILLFIYFIGGIFYSLTNKDEKTKENAKVDNGITIKGFSYILYEDTPSIYKEEFNNLKKNLENKEINYEEYAKSISKMFLIDLYSLNLKKNMYDVGGTEFIYPESVENYKLNVQNTLYKYMEDNTDGKRKQELPEVKNVVIKDIEETEFKLEETKHKAFKINANIEYIKDLKYENKAEIIIIKEDKYLYIVEKN